MFVNFHGVEIKVPDNAKCVVMDGKEDGYKVWANTQAKLVWSNDGKTWWVLRGYAGLFTPIDLSEEDKAKIRSVVKPKNSLVRISKKG